MRKALSYIIGFALAFITLQSNVFAQNTLNGLIKGKVKGKEDALEAATVSVGKNTVLTSQLGDYSISVKPGIYIITISYAGYQKIQQEVIVKSCETIELNFILVPGEQMGEVVVLGSRSVIQRSNLNAPVPVDIISARKLPLGETGITQQLAGAFPSFNSPPQTIGTGSHINPATLRGLGPDETLVLLNGRRRHTTENISLQYGIGYGTVCTDFNAIPSAAIENIEVLRDGAAAQYGSDAIAGVINLQLKKTTGITSVNLHLGQYYKRDGETISFDINRGIRLNKNGFLNVTAAVRFSNYTQRNGVYDSTVYYNIPKNASPHITDSIRALDNKMVEERGFDRLNHRRIGSPRILNAGLILNGGYPVSKKTNLFWTGTMNYRFGDDEASVVYRYPKDSTTVIKEIYPDGFEPHYFSTIVDGSLIAGIEGETGNEWHWDLSSVYGGNSYHWQVFNTNNASQFAMGKNAQTDFYIGTLLFTQNTNNINFTRNFAKYFRRVKSFTASFGGEFRIDHYRIKEGEEASWKNYAPTSGRIGGSQGPGYSPDNAVNKNRYVSGAYAELEMDKNEKFLWNIATRYEYYSDFGGNLAGKLAMRYKFSEHFMLRGSISNGFRAPSIQQRYFSAINQIGGRNVFGISVTGTYRNDGEVAAAFGIPPLQAERSLNVSSGITLKISRHINLTLDAYWIQISNRVILTGSIQRNITTPRVARILDSLNRKDINAVRFFTNAINTRTKGIDLVVTGSWPIHKSILEVTLSGNYNKTNIYRVIQPAKNLPDDSVYQFTIIDPQERGRLERSQPLDKIIMAVNYKTGKWKFSARSVHFGKVAHINIGADRNRDEFYSPKIISGFNISYSPKSWITITTGASNIFNVYPDKLRNRANTQAGLLIYDANSTQIGYNGGYYFMKMEFNW